MASSNERPFFDFGEHDVGGGVEHAGKSAQIRGGQAERETCEKIGTPSITVDFVEKATIFSRSRASAVSSCESVDDGAFVRSNGVRAEFERGFEMIDGGLPVCGVERAGFENNVGASVFQPLANVARSGCRDLRGAASGR